uniref:alpha/beta hydrolase family protein n=1 Tax=uncultured Caulobacter sp. TaxID=158749 RepID=UPI0025F3FA4D|nr:S9 family peptidase [uncultured Caulobacter sp.]
MLKLMAAASMAALLSVAPAQGAPLEAYGRLPTINSVDVSPDGSALALIVTVNDESQVIVKSLAGPVLASTKIGFRKVRSVQWADGDHIVIEVSNTAVIDGVSYFRENYQAVSLNVRTGDFVQLPTKAMDTVVNVIAGRIQPARDGQKPVLLAPLMTTEARNMQSKGSHLDLFKVDLESGQATVVQMGDADTYDYLASADGKVLAKASYKENQAQNNATWTMSLRKGGGWQTVFSTTEAAETPSLWGVSPDGQAVIIDTWDKETSLWRPTPIGLADGKAGGFVGPARSLSPVIGPDGVVLGFSYHDNFIEYDFIEPRLKALWPAFRGAFKGQLVALTSWTPDFKKLILYVEGENSAGAYYVADTTTKRVDPIGVAYSKIGPADIARVREIRYPAGDGLEIDAILTMPKGRGEKNLPLIVLPHGGPEAYDTTAFDWWAQALASRGYAVLQPNFRGSTNRGHAFKTAGYGEWGRKMQTDLSDGVAFLAKQGVVDSKRVCIFGGSYGGYAALAGVTLQKGVYRCAVSLAGPSDLPGRLHDEILRYGEQSARIRYRKRFYGVTGERDPKLREISPAAHAGAVEAPILLIHGKDDTVVPYSESQKMASALKAAGKPYEFVTLDGEDHWLSRSQTRLQMLTTAVAFLEKHNPPN